MACLTAVSANTSNAASLGRTTGVWNPLQGVAVWRFSGNEYVLPGETKDQILIFPEMPIDTLKDISFFYRGSSSYATFTFAVGYSATTNDTGSFIWYDATSVKNDSWKYYEKLNIPTNAKYIAIKFSANSIDGTTQYIDAYIDSVVITGRVSVANDLAVSAINWPLANSANLSADEKVKVTIFNWGEDAAENYRMYVQVNGNTPVSEDVTVTVPAYGSIVYTFTEGVDLSAFETYSIKVWAEISGDANNSNDTAFITITNNNCTVTLPYYQGFESSDILPCWTLETNSPGTTASEWNVGWGIFGNFKHNGDSAFRFYSDGVFDVGQYLISPAFPETESVKELSFYYGMYSEYGGGTQELFKVGYSTTTNELSSFIWGDEQEIPMYNSGVWFKYLNSFPNNAKYFAIHYYSTNRYNTYIDELSVKEIKYTTDLRVLSFVDLPEIDTLAPSAILDVPVKVAVRNDSTAISGIVTFGYSITDINSGEEIESTLESSTMTIAKDDPFTYTFDGSASIFDTGTYRIKAWVELSEDYINLHNDTIEAIILVVGPIITGGEVLKSGFKAIIYPNPSNGVLTVTTSSRSTVEVIDVRGIVVDRVTVSGSKELSIKSKGLYLFNFIDSFGNRVTERVLVK
jgi:hypothetical protein